MCEKLGNSLICLLVGDGALVGAEPYTVGNGLFALAYLHTAVNVKELNIAKELNSCLADSRLDGACLGCFVANKGEVTCGSGELGKCGVLRLDENTTTI